MSEIKLLPCPFCGGGAEIGEFHLLDKEYRVCCKECRSRTPYSASIDRVIKQWNTRKPMERIVERLEELSMRYFLTIANTGNRENDVAYENVANVLNGVIAICKEEGGIE